MKHTFLLVICIGCCMLTSISLFYDIRVALKRQQQAFAGDSIAAKRIILPCYKPLIRGFLLFNILFAIILAATLAKKANNAHKVVVYFFFCLLTTYTITPVMLVQTSVSRKSFWTTFFVIFPYWACCTLFWALFYHQENATASRVVGSLFVIGATLPPFLLSVGILTKLLSSRVQVGSNSNRNSTELLLVYSLCFGVFQLVELSGPADHSIADLVMTILTFVVNQIFPFALYRTLLADTKFWRGLGKHNRCGMDRNDVLRQSGVDVHRPAMELSVVSSSFQDMMADINDLTVDFAFLRLEKLIGEGATAKVFCGQFKRRPVAIKLSTPPEITEEVMDVFVAEARIAAMLRHKNIVEFIGICVRPPQIGTVFEFCEGGDLKSHLHQNMNQWTTKQKLKACLDASNAINVLHSKRFIHRDIKAENFFVAKDLVVKLGDFGEATMFRSIESTIDTRMTIVGTVAFMAPELVAGERYYSEAIDIYALGVTFWEIWMIKDPYEGLSTFDIYDHVKEGRRLPLPDDAPMEFIAVMEQTWMTNPAARPKSYQLVNRIETILKTYLADIGEDVEVVEEEMKSSSKNPLLKRFGDSMVEMVTLARKESSDRLSFSIRSSMSFDNHATEGDGVCSARMPFPLQSTKRGSSQSNKEAVNEMMRNDSSKSTAEVITVESPIIRNN